jgi:F0F1-type ATP synthase membrane subunit b/b'
MLKSIFTTFAVLVLSTSLSTQAATPIFGIDSLKQNVVKSFLQKANNPKAELHKQLQQFNQDNTDGRNSQGFIPKVLTANHIKIIPIGGEDQFGSYCSPP